MNRTSGNHIVADCNCHSHLAETPTPRRARTLNLRANRAPLVRRSAAPDLGPPGESPGKIP